MPSFLVFNLTRLRIKPELTISIADHLFTQPLISIVKKTGLPTAGFTVKSKLVVFTTTSASSSALFNRKVPGKIM